MDLKDLMTWPWNRPGAAPGDVADAPFRALQIEVNRAFDRVLRAMPTPRLHADWGLSLDSFDLPIDLIETETAIEVRADVPGIAEDDIEVAIGGDALTIIAERRARREQEGQTYRINERRAGAFRRTVTLPAAVDEDAVTATVSDGVLTIVVPKLQPGGMAMKKIPIAKG